MASMKRSAVGRDYVDGHALSDDLRSLIVEDIKGSKGDGNTVPHGTMSTVARKYKLSASCVNKIWKRYVVTGDTTRAPIFKGGAPPKLTEQDLQFIEVTKRETPSITSKEVKSRLCEYSVFQNGLSVTTVERAVRTRMSDGPWSYKKITRPNCDRFSVDNLRYTQAYLDYMYQKDPHKVLFFDESGFKVTVASRQFGHSKVGDRCIELSRYHAGPNVTLNLLVGLNGVRYFNFVDGASNTGHFVNFFHEAVEAYNDDFLAALSPGDIVVVDNCPFHHHDGERILSNYLDNMGITLVFLPTYSPDLSPAEPCFMKVKTLLKQERFSTMMKANLKLAVSRALDDIHSSDMEGFYKATESFQV
jgi:transposase